MADQVFADAGGIKITSSGKRHLGAVIGSDTFKDEYVNEKIGEWVKEIEALAEIALIEPLSLRSVRPWIPAQIYFCYENNPRDRKSPEKVR